MVKIQIKIRIKWGLKTNDVTPRFPNINSYKEYQSFSSKMEHYIQLTKIPLYK